MADIFPFIQPGIINEQSELNLYKEVKWDFKEDLPIFKNGETIIVTGKEAVKVWIWNALKTVRKRYKIYTWNYGNDVEELIGSPYSYELKKEEAARYIKECLTINPYITNITNINTDFNEDNLIISFKAETIYGDIHMGGDVFV